MRYRHGDMYKHLDFESIRCFGTSSFGTSCVLLWINDELCPERLFGTCSSQSRLFWETTWWPLRMCSWSPWRRWQHNQHCLKHHSHHDYQRQHQHPLVPPNYHQECVHGAPEEGGNTINIVINLRIINTTDTINTHKAYICMLWICK